MGESWLAGDDNVIVNGVHAGRTVADLVREWGAALIGTAAFERYGARMPLLAKLLDAAHDLSVQVHPDDAYALREETASGYLGKSEAWYVLETEPGASVLWGFKRDVTREQVLKAVDEGALPSLMNRLVVAAGDVVVNPAGTVHAVGAGVRLFEIQQASDLTYRLYDYGRLSAAGQPRQLHLDQGLAVADLRGHAFTPAVPRALADGWWRLVERPEFVLDRRELNRGAGAEGAVAEGEMVEGHVGSDSMELLSITLGEVALSARNGAWETLTLRRGDTALLPAGLPGVYRLHGSGELLRCAVVKDEL